MFKPNQSQSQETQQLIEKIFMDKVPSSEQYNVVYGYFMKSGLFSKKVTNYVVGFSKQGASLVLITIDSNGNSGETVVLEKNNIVSAKFGMQGDVKIKTDANQEYRVMVPGYTPSSAASTYMLPIDQTDKAVQFRSFVKENF